MIGFYGLSREVVPYLLNLVLIVIAVILRQYVVVEYGWGFVEAVFLVATKDGVSGRTWIFLVRDAEAIHTNYHRRGE